jgi:hypothetical protein
VHFLESRWPNGANIVGGILLATVVACIVVRLTIGVDLGDETFYASFIDDWLKEGIRNSPLITVTQTSALIVYPFAFAYNAVTRSTDGLMLFCRSLYLAFSFATAVVALAFLRDLGMRSSTWLGAAAIVAFIPFGLPAPSYNSFGLQGLLAAAASLGCAALARERSATVWLWVAGAAATIAVVAYPPMIVPIVSCYAMALFTGAIDGRAIVPFVATVLAGCAAVVLSLSPARISAMLIGTVAPGFGLGHRLGVISHQLTSDGRFVAIWVVACGLGLARARMPGVAVGGIQLVLLAATILIPPPLFIDSHVAVFVIALTGIALLRNLRGDAALRDRIPAIVYATGLLAGCTTTFTTSENGLFNFAIGGFPAALAALLPRGDVLNVKVVGDLAVAGFAGVLLWTSLTSYYGELGNPHARELIQKGWYAGIWATPERATLIGIASAALAPLGPACTISVVGLPVYYLLSPCVPRTLMAYPINDIAQRGVFEATLRYYSDPAHLPEFVVEEDDRTSYADFPFPDLHRWFNRYRLAEALRTPFDGTLRIYQRLAGPVPSP